MYGEGNEHKQLRLRLETDLKPDDRLSTVLRMKEHGDVGGGGGGVAC